MSRHVFPLPDLVIPIGTAESNVIYDYLDGDGFRDASDITVFGPDTLPETVEVQVDSSRTATNFNPLNNEVGAVINVPPGEAIAIEGTAYKALKLVSTSGNVAATRTFKVNKSVEV